MAAKDHSAKRMGFLAIATAAAGGLALLHENDRGNWLIYLAGAWVIAIALFGALRPDIVDLDIN